MAHLVLFFAFWLIVNETFYHKTVAVLVGFY